MNSDMFTVYQPVPGTAGAHGAPAGPPGPHHGSHPPLPAYNPVAGPSGTTPQDNVAFELDDDPGYSIAGGAPPSYEEVINSTRFPIVRTRKPVNDDRSWKVDFVDFTPHLPNNPGNKQLGNFRNLLQRLNTWLKSNPDIQIIRCETITWSGVTLAALNETNVVQQSRSLNSGIKTRYLRGIRLWFVPLLTADPEDGVPPVVPPINIDLLEFAPSDTEENLQNLIKKLNKRLKTDPLPGKVLTIESVWAKSNSSKISMAATYWTEKLHKTRQYGFFIRIYFIRGEARPLEIGIKDFLPAQTSDSYENFSHVTEKAGNWVMEQPDISVTNLQAVYIKKKGPPSNCNNRCFWTEHPIKPDASITYFYQICRVAYVKYLMELNVLVHVPLQLTKKTFAPALLPPCGEEQETRFENFTKTVERVSSWLDSTGAQVFCMETVPVRVQTAFQQRQGPEATLVWSLAEPGVKNEDWLIFVRVYVKGELREPRVTHMLSMPPIDWYRRQNNPPITAPPARRRNYVICCLIVLIAVIGSFIIMYIAYSFVV